jgi:outer membrane protein TolC
MSRDGRAFWAVLLSVLTPLAGCTPSRTFYFHEDGDLSYYKGMATAIEYPDVESATLDEVTHALPPATLRNIEDYQFWDLCLQDAVQTALHNSKVIRLLNGPTTDFLLTGRAGQDSTGLTIYDPAIQQSNPGQGGRIGGGVESALSAFDAQLAASLFWEHNEQPRNVRFNPAIQQIFARDFLQETATFQAELAKQTASGARFAVSHQTIYDGNNNPTRDVISDYNTQFQVEARQPLLQGAGTLFNRIAGPGLGPGNFSGVVIARINGDISLADFEAQVQNQVKQVEDTYWDLYAAYRVFDAARQGRDAVLQAWRRVKALSDVGALGGGALDVARSEQEYLLFKSQTEQALQALYAAESRLRYLMGLSPTDGRLIRPCDEPTTARLDFDWCLIHNEALARQVNLRRQKWQIKRVEMELIASRNFLLPRLDAVARYRWLGLGDDLIDPNGQGIDPNNFTIAGTDAFSTLTDGNYQEWEAGFQFNMPIGFRRELAGVRFSQLRLARERAILQDQELEVSHLLSDAVRGLHYNHAITESLFNRGIAARREVNAAQAIFDEGAELQTQGVSILDRLLDAQRRRAEAERDYFRQLAEYAKSISNVHFRKGSLLEYNNVLLAEGPWPGKAYMDAYNRARERDAGHCLNYGYTRPSVISRGPYDQFGGQIFGHDGSVTPTPAEQIPPPRDGEEMPAPGTQPMPLPEPSVLNPAGPRLGMDNAAPTPAAPMLEAPAGVESAPAIEAGPTIGSPSAGTRTRPAGFRPPRPLPR